MCTRLPLFVLALVAPLAAQRVVVPPHFAETEGNTYSYSYLFNTTTPNRLMQIHGGVPAMTIKSLAFRRDSGWATEHATFRLIYNMYLSNAARTPGTPDKTFENNHGANKAQVATFQVANLPASGPGLAPRPFDHVLPLTVPYVFNGSGDLCLDIHVQSRTNGFNVVLDAVSSRSTNPGAYVMRWGTGCKSTGNSSKGYLTASSSPNWPGRAMSLSYNGRYLPKNGIGTLLIGMNDEMWGGTPLPFTLPGSQTAPSGACILYTDILVQLPALIDAGGRINQSVGFAINPWFNGKRILTQVVARDAGANPWGLVLTNAVEHHFVGPWSLQPVARIASQRTLGPTGTAQANVGLVVEVR